MPEGFRNAELELVSKLSDLNVGVFPPQSISGTPTPLYAQNIMSVKKQHSKAAIEAVQIAVRKEGEATKWMKSVSWRAITECATSAIGPTTDSTSNPTATITPHPSNTAHTEAAPPLHMDEQTVHMHDQHDSDDDTDHNDDAYESITLEELLGIDETNDPNTTEEDNDSTHNGSSESSHEQYNPWEESGSDAEDETDFSSSAPTLTQSELDMII